MNTKFNTVKTVNSTTSFLNTLSVKNLEEKIKDYLNEYLVFNKLSKLTEFISVNPVRTTGRAITRTIRTRTTEYDYLPLTD